MRFVVIADTHVRSDETDPGDFPANRMLAGRNEHVVDIIERLTPDVVIHLGDVVHPVPGNPDHDAANDLAAAAYRRLTAPLYVVPGNHDVGDKPYPWVDAPTVTDAHYAAFAARWGPRHQTFTRAGCRFVLLDTPVFNTGDATEEEQWSWLEETLAAAAAAGERIFLFGHYPPYLWEADEEEHYDNLGPAARRRLLEMISGHGVEAVFSGHVHRFFHRRHHETDLYVVPAVGFVRPGYSEFDAVAPVEEHGRDDRAKLGLFVVEVGAAGHTVRPVRTWGRVGAAHADEIEAARQRSLQLGVTMRHGWAAPRDLTMGGLDEFVRKRARPDAPVLALWEAGIDRVRIPAADLQHADARGRIMELAARGTCFTVLVPGPDVLGRLPGLDGIERWEVVLEPGAPWAACAPHVGRVAVGPVVPRAGTEWRGAHFVSHGFNPMDANLGAVVGDTDEAVFRVASEVPIWEAATVAVEAATSAGVSAVLIVELSRFSEGRMFDDDALVANRAVEAEIVARAHGAATVFLDGFIDHDRGYFPRRGLLDRRGNPRDAFRALVAFGTFAVDEARWRPTGGREGIRIFTDGDRSVFLVSEHVPVPAGSVPVSLVDGRHATDVLSPGPWSYRAHHRAAPISCPPG